MKMIVSIVNSSDARGLTDALMRKGYRATEISTTGGFLRRRNATVVIGIEDEKADDVLEIITLRVDGRTWVHQQRHPCAPLQSPTPDIVTTSPKENGASGLYRLSRSRERAITPSRVLVLEAGRLVEDSPAEAFFDGPGSEAGRRLMEMEREP